MPPLEVFDLYQYAVLWRKTGQDRYNDPTLALPVQIMVRWVNKRLESVDNAGNVIALDANVAAAVEIPVGSHMWLGTFEEWFGTGSAGNDTQVMEVRIADKVPDVKGRAIRYEYGLAFYKDDANG